LLSPVSSDKIKFIGWDGREIKRKLHKILWPARKKTEWTKYM